MTENDKMNYPEQFTYEETHKIVPVFGHLRGEYAYNAATKQLEDGYGDTEVIANTFKKKVFEWLYGLKPGYSKAQDEFSLFLMEC